MSVPAGRPEPTSGPLSFTAKLFRFGLARQQRLCALAMITLFLACVWRYWMPFDPQRPVPRTMEMPRTAINLYEKGQFSNPFFLADTGPSAHVAPGFPLYMDLLMHMFGDQAGGLFALKISAILVVALQVALFPVFSQCLGMGRLTGLIAGCAWIVAKPMLEWNWEGYYTALPFAITCCVYRKYLDSTLTRRRWIAWMLGFLMGFLVLLGPTCALVLVAWLGWEIWRLRSRFSWASFLPMIVLPALMISPWLIRNYYVFHRLIIRDDLGLELSASNNDCAKFALRINLYSGCFDSVHPNGSLTEALKVAQMGEVRYNDQRLHEALGWIRAHPSRFIKLTAKRFVAFWLPTETGNRNYTGTGRGLERFLIYFTTLLSAAGLWRLYRLDSKSALVCLTCLIFYPPVYYIVAFVDRYRHPLMWLTFLLGSFPIANFLGTKLDRLEVCADNPQPTLRSDM